MIEIGVGKGVYSNQWLQIISCRYNCLYDLDISFTWRVHITCTLVTRVRSSVRFGYIIHIDLCILRAHFCVAFFGVHAPVRNTPWRPKMSYYLAAQRFEPCSYHVVCDANFFWLLCRLAEDVILVSLSFSWSALGTLWPCPRHVVCDANFVWLWFACGRCTTGFSVFAGTFILS